MANFSDLNLGVPQIPLQETATKKVVKIESESGYLRSRARSVRAFKNFVIKYNDLSDDQLQDLIDFFDVNSGESFVWSHPITSSSYNVIFNDESLVYSYNALDRVEVSIALREVF